MEGVTIQVLHAYLWICLALFILYSPRIAMYFFAFTQQARVIGTRMNRLAVIVPARDESTVVTHCLDSLVSQTYDHSMFDTYVVVADAEDPTTAIAANYPRTNVSVVSQQTGKGEALDGVLKYILEHDPNTYDAFVILDADNVAAPDLLEEMNNALSTGKQIVCAKKLIKNWMDPRKRSRSFISNCTALIYPQVDDMGNMARNVFGAAIMMIGTGMMIRADVIKQLGGWPYRGLTDDYEMTADAILKGWSSMYYSHAQVYTEEATDAKTAYRRRLRWVKGYTQCQNRYGPAVLKAVLTRKIPWWNHLFVVGTYPAYAFFAVSIIAMLFGLYAVASSIAVNSPSLGTSIRMVAVPVVLMYLAIFFFTLIAMLAEWRNIKIPTMEKAALLIAGPIYTFGYVRIFIASFFTRDDYFKWEPTRRSTTSP